MFVRNIHALLFKRRTLRAYFTEACRDDDGGFDSAAGALFDGLRCDLRRHDEDRQIHGIGDLRQAGVQLTLEELSLSLADEVDRARVSAGDEVARRAVAEFFRRGGCADNNDAFGLKEGKQGG